MQAGDIPPTELQYVVKEFPKLGHVVNITTSSEGNVLNYITSFTQDDIDQGLIAYASFANQVQLYLIYSAMQFILFLFFF